MQLFIVNFEIESNHIYISDTRLSHQLKNVLRAKQGYRFFLQDPENSSTKFRYLVEFLWIGQNIDTKIIEKIEINCVVSESWMIIPILNKFDKVELIVQKLSEIWINRIIIYHANRSQIMQLSENKLTRLNLISLEAVEQSKWTILPEIVFEKDFEFVLEKYKPIVFHQDWEKNFTKNSITNYWLIWPEGGFDEFELKIINQKSLSKINISQNIFRAETAAIVWWFLIKTFSN